MEYSISTTLGYEEVEINTHGDKIHISPDDAAMMDNFVKCFDNIVKMSDENAKKCDEIEKKYAGKEGIENDIAMDVELSGVNVDFSNKSIEAIDSIFGDGTIRLYFRDHYENVAHFLPGTACFMDFFTQISPVMEDIFGKAARNIEELSKAKMAKYQPRDHKRPQK